MTSQSLLLPTKKKKKKQKKKTIGVEFKFVQLVVGQVKQKEHKKKDIKSTRSNGTKRTYNSLNEWNKIKHRI